MQQGGAAPAVEPHATTDERQLFACCSRASAVGRCIFMDSAAPMLHLRGLRRAEVAMRPPPPGGAASGLPRSAAAAQVVPTEGGAAAPLWKGDRVVEVQSQDGAVEVAVVVDVDHVLPRKLGYLSALADLAREHDVLLVFARLPKRGESGGWTPHGGDPEGEIVTDVETHGALSTVLPPLQNTLFGDDVHLGHAGADALSAELGAALAPLLDVRGTGLAPEAPGLGEDGAGGGGAPGALPTHPDPPTVR
jgi:hypothetical protein